MNIGLDIDNVLTAFDGKILKEFLIEDKNKRNTGFVNKKACGYHDGLLDWKDEEISTFLSKNMEKFAEEFRMRKNCKYYIDKLKGDGHKIFLISHRVYPDYIHPYETTSKWLEKHKIFYDKLIISEEVDKTKECRKYKIDVMVDDHNCKVMTEQGVNCILMLTQFNKRKLEGFKYAKENNIPVATSWKNLYEVISKWKK